MNNSQIDIFQPDMQQNSGTAADVTTSSHTCTKPLVGGSTSRDWTGNSKTTFATLGASSHSENERQIHDYYATDPKAIKLLLELEQFKNVWECACGEGHLSKVLQENGIHGKSTDLIDRGFGQGGVDFLSIEVTEWNGDIITNPPFKYAQEFVEKALRIIPTGNKVAMFLRVQFLETKDRKIFFQAHPPKTVYVSSSRILCAINGEFDKYQKNGSAACYCWFVWEKGFSGKTVIEWFN